MKSHFQKAFPASLPAFILAVFLGGCALETERAIDPRKVSLAGTKYEGPKETVSIDRFRCCATQTRPSAAGRLEEQARALLLAHLQQTGRFRILENREHPDQTTGGTSGPTYIICEDIIEFGRKETTDWELWGILSGGRRQIAHAKVNILILHKNTGRVVSSAQGEGQCKFHSRNYAAFSVGGTSGYDSVLSGKVMDLAIVEAVNRLSKDLESGLLNP